MKRPVMQKLQTRKRKLKEEIINQEWGNGADLTKLVDKLETTIIELCQQTLTKEED